MGDLREKLLEEKVMALIKQLEEMFPGNGGGLPFYSDMPYEPKEGGPDWGRTTEDHIAFLEICIAEKKRPMSYVSRESIKKTKRMIKEGYVF